ncbi:MAG: phosphatase PAP2 family protein [Thermoplasmata archaeon]
MVLSYPVFFTLYSISMVVGVFAGLLLTVGWKDMYWRKALISAKYNAVYLVLLTVLPLFIQGQDLLERHLAGPDDSTREVVYTNWIFKLSGGAIRVIQDRLDYRLMTDFFILVYAWLFTYLLYFAPILLLAKDDRANLRKYAIAMVFNYVILIPFYLLFPVSVSGSYPESGITPLLYVDTYWGKMVTSVDPLNNNFPSGHVSLAVTTLLVFATERDRYRRFYHFLIAATICIAFSVLYLGIHWPADVFAGCLVAVAATVASRSEKIQMAVDRYVRALSQRLFREEETEITSPPRT